MRGHRRTQASARAQDKGQGADSARKRHLFRQGKPPHRPGQTTTSARASRHIGQGKPPRFSSSLG